MLFDRVFFQLKRSPWKFGTCNQSVVYLYLYMYNHVYIYIHFLCHRYFHIFICVMLMLFYYTLDKIVLTLADSPLSMEKQAGVQLLDGCVACS